MSCSMSGILGHRVFCQTKITQTFSRVKTLWGFGGFKSHECICTYVMNLSSEINGAFIMGGDETTWVELSYRFMDPQLGVDAVFWVDKNHIWKHLFLSIMGLDKQKSLICAYSQLQHTSRCYNIFFLILRIINSDRPPLLVRESRLNVAHWGSATPAGSVPVLLWYWTVGAGFVRFRLSIRLTWKLKKEAGWGLRWDGGMGPKGGLLRELILLMVLKSPTTTWDG